MGVRRGGGRRHKHSYQVLRRCLKGWKCLNVICLLPNGMAAAKPCLCILVWDP